MKTIKRYMPLMGATGNEDYMTRDPKYMTGGLRAFQGDYEFHPIRKKFKGYQRENRKYKMTKK